MPICSGSTAWIRRRGWVPSDATPPAPTRPPGGTLSRPPATVWQSDCNVRCTKSSCIRTIGRSGRDDGAWLRTCFTCFPISAHYRDRQRPSGRATATCAARKVPVYGRLVARAGMMVRGCALALLAFRSRHIIETASDRLAERLQRALHEKFLYTDDWSLGPG